MKKEDSLRIQIVLDSTNSLKEFVAKVNAVISDGGNVTGMSVDDRAAGSVYIDVTTEWEEIPEPEEVTDGRLMCIEHDGSLCEPNKRPKGFCTGCGG